MNMNISFHLIIVFALLCPGLLFGNPKENHIFGQPFPIQNSSVKIVGHDIIASQGSDESAQKVTIRIWGQGNREEWGFQQLDNDPEKEYAYLSRGIGTGPYYVLQIIDFRPSGILTWSYWSAGKPKLVGKNVKLGHMPKGYEGSQTKYVYRSFHFTKDGLKP